ncbi:uncharacterized protein K452DRAFT_362979 [Aplosporella prunicola CBS 121167]|uniref:Uncharacterized protein n=1 Tax=Aplosporella prunicola CBS 121167 TaxID=1176127 RepID=A0A6A6AWT4_9PEZI|nr:uncharacterized protein K452DRAFT_362979 [Aplosporella prunicola CBS 121167]KAF2135728.1 hypothetical protein K452DRAFT_362979 [Aplosporella prunicola CBS 121167]
MGAEVKRRPSFPSLFAFAFGQTQNGAGLPRAPRRTIDARLVIPVVALGAPDYGQQARPSDAGAASSPRSSISMAATRQSAAVGSWAAAHQRCAAPCPVRAHPSAPKRLHYYGTCRVPGVCFSSGATICAPLAKALGTPRGTACRLSSSSTAASVQPSGPPHSTSQGIPLLIQPIPADLPPTLDRCPSLPRPAWLLHGWLTPRPPSMRQATSISPASPRTAALPSPQNP